MNANNTFENMIFSWYGYPGKLWDTWQAAFKGSLSTPWERLYMHPLDASESLVDTFLQTRSDWIRTCVNSVRSGNDDATAIDQWADKTQALADGWSEVQRGMWSAWFRALKDLHPARSIVALPGGTQTLSESSPGLHVWQEAVRNMIKLQALWASVLIPEHTGAEQAEHLMESARQKPEKPAQAA